MWLFWPVFAAATAYDLFFMRRWSERRVWIVYGIGMGATLLFGVACFLWAGDTTLCSLLFG